MSFILQNSNPWIGLQFLGSGKKQIRSRLRQKNETVYYCEGDDFTKAIMILAFLSAYGFLRGEIFVWCHIHVADIVCRRLAKRCCKAALSAAV